MVCECNPVLDATIQHILTCIDHFNLREATFVAERLFAEYHNDETIYLLACCYYRCNLPKKTKAFLLRQDSKSPKCKYLLARCCMDIGCAAEAEDALLGQDITTPSDIVIFYKETAPFVLQMLADIYKLSDRRKQAIEYLKKCLDYYPFYWTPYADLIDLRENIDPNDVFSLSNGSILNNHSCLRALSNKINIGDISHPNCPSKKRTDMHDSQEDLSVSRENVNPQFDENFNDPNHGNDVISITNESLPYSFNRTPLKVEMDITNNSDCPSANSFNECFNNVETGNHLRQKLCAPKQYFRDDEFDKSKPMFGNIFSGPSTMLTCAPIMNVAVTETPENIQTNFQSHDSLVISQHNIINPKKNRNTNKRISYSSFRPTSSTPLFPCKPEKMAIFNHPSTPIAKTSDHNNALSSLSPLVYDSSYAVDIGKSVETSQSVEIKLPNSVNMDYTSCGPRTRSQAAKAAAAQKSTFLKKPLPSKDDHVHTKALCEGIDPQHQSTISKQLHEPNNRLQNALNYLQLLIAMGKCYKSLRQCRFNEVISNIKLLPKHQADTALVNSWLATALMENNWTKSCETLSLSHQTEPWQLHGMVMYSTLLWKSKNEAQLLSLANEITDMDRETPEFWCILGNCITLNKENEIALRYFQRAIQINPCYTYGYILLGHEYYEQDELDKALNSFRKALEFDSNQYGAYYGIAMVYQRQEKYIEADKALKEALKINPDSCFLLTNLVGVRMRLKQFYPPEESLELLEKACSSCPKDPLCRFQKATLLYQLGRYQESLQDLKFLESITNKEARIYLLMSLNYKQLGEMTKAMMYNTWATELDPKCTNDSFMFDRSFVTNPVINVSDHISNNSIMSSRNTGFSVSGRRNSESMQEDSSEIHHNSDFINTD